MQRTQSPDWSAPTDDAARRMVIDCPWVNPCFGESSIGPLKPPKKTPRRRAIRGQSEVEAFLSLIDSPEERGQNL